MKMTNSIPLDSTQQIDENLAKLEAALGAKFGDTENPLLLSVRSGAAVSMPGYDGHHSQPRLK